MLVQTYISYYMCMTVHVTADVFTASLGPCVPRVSRVSRAAPECVVGGATAVVGRRRRVGGVSSEGLLSARCKEVLTQLCEHLVQGGVKTAV